jgi:2,3-bisphosphoglycerate-independent phosphoglycerate mutase
VAPLASRALAAEAEPTAKLINDWVAQAQKALRDAHPANMLTLRGIAKQPPMPLLPEVCKLRAAAIAAYPMYRGLAKLVGMDVLRTGATFADEMATLKANWDKYDYFFIHFKRADAAGEDGDFQEKIAALEEIDAYIDDLHDLQADVFMVAGDHSTPAVVAGHSWHPVPFLFHAKNFNPGDPTPGFNEKACAQGILGAFPAKEVMSLAMAYAGRLTKYGA